MLAVVCGVSVALTGALGLVGWRYEEAMVDDLIAGIEATDELAAAELAETRDRLGEYEPVLEHEFFASEPWATRLAEEESADDRLTHVLRSNALAAAGGLIFPGPRARYLAFTSTLDVSIAAPERLRLYVLMLAEAASEGGPDAARELGTAMFGDGEVLEGVLEAIAS